MSDPLSIAASVVALVQLATVATGFLKDVKDGGGERLKLRDELRSTTCVLEMIHDRIDEQQEYQGGAFGLKPAAVLTMAGRDGPLERFKTTLEELVAKLVPKARLGKVSMPLTWPFEKKQVMELTATLERVKTHFSLVLQNDLSALAKLTFEQVERIEKQVGDLDASRKHQEFGKILDWISPASFRAQQAEVLQSVQPGTGQWFLNHESFLDWRKGKVNVLWCPGMPGAGKTRLASLAIAQLATESASSHVPFAYIYCNYNKKESQTQHSVLSSLLEQLLRQTCTSALPPEVSSLYEMHTQHGTRPTLRQMCDATSQVVGSYSHVHVVIDGLDEYAQAEESAMELISAVRQTGPVIRLLTTSRFSTAFENYFSGAPRIQIAAQDQDIRLYLETQMPSQARLYKHVTVDPSLRGEIIENITKGARGMFLLARLYLESLSRKITRRDVRKALHTLPATLDATYALMLSRIRSQAEEDAELAETIISWILCAQRPLSVPELASMFAMRMLLEDSNEPGELEEDDLPPGDIVTGVCGGLIVVDEPSGTVEFVHYTAQDYLLRTYKDTLHDRHCELTRVSLAYLQLSNFATGLTTSDSSMLKRLETFPLLDYAARFWGCNVTQRYIDHHWDNVYQFLSNPIAVELASQVSSLTRNRHAYWSEEYPRNIPAIVLAASFDIPAALEKLVGLGHGIESSGSDGETALIRAARLGHATNVKTLLRLGADINAMDVAGETAIERATTAGEASTVKALLDGGANANTTTGTVGWTVLMSAVTSGNFEAVKLLIGAGAVAASETVWGDSALSLATLSGQEAMAYLLVDSGAMLTLNKAGRRAYLQASKKGLRDLVKRLTLSGCPNYDAIADAGLRREELAFGQRLSEIAEVGEGDVVASDNDDSHKKTNPSEDGDPKGILAVMLQGLPYQRGFHRRYIIEDGIRYGAAGQMSACVNRVTRVRYAVRSTKFGNGHHHSDIERDEILAMTELRHVNMTHLVDMLVSDAMDELYLVLELPAQGDLFTYIVNTRKRSENEARRVFGQVFSALGFMVSGNGGFYSSPLLFSLCLLGRRGDSLVGKEQHREGWAHRDIRPENILLHEGNMVKITNFGLAVKLRNHRDETDDTLCGIPSYVAPEILAKAASRSYSYKVDVWSTGVVLYCFLCGFHPFDDELYSDDFPYTLSQQIKSGRYGYPCPYWDNVGDDARDLIDSMLVVIPTYRSSIDQCMEHRWMLETIPPL